MQGGQGDDRFVFTDNDFGGGAWTDFVDGHGDNSNQGSGFDTIDLTGVSQGWTMEIDGQGQHESGGDGPSEYVSGSDFSGTITFEDGSTAVFENIEKVDW